MSDARDTEPNAEHDHETGDDTARGEPADRTPTTDEDGLPVDNPSGG